VLIFQGLALDGNEILSKAVSPRPKTDEPITVDRGVRAGNLRNAVAIDPPAVPALFSRKRENQTW